MASLNHARHPMGIPFQTVSKGKFLGGCLRGQPCTFEQLTATPMAAAMRDAYKIYIGNSQPLHPELQRILSRVVPPGVLYHARITIGATPDLTVPGFLNAGYELFGSSHAVTLGNLMIFSRDLNFSDLNDWEFLLHELHHVQQYGNYFGGSWLEAIDGFSVDYLRQSGKMESQAERAAASRLQQLKQICYYSC